MVHLNNICEISEVVLNDQITLVHSMQCTDRQNG